MTSLQSLRVAIAFAFQQLQQRDPAARYTDSKTLATKIQRINPRIKPRTMDDVMFRDFVELVAIQEGLLLPRSEAKLVAANLAPADAGFSITPARAEQVADGQLRMGGMRFALDGEHVADDAQAKRFDEIADAMIHGRPLSRSVKLSADGDTEAQRFDKIADDVVWRGSRMPQGKAPGPTEFLKSMTPAQRQRFEALNQRAAPIAKQRRANEIDFILDILEKNLEADEQMR